MWGYDYDAEREHQEREERYAFEVTCGHCGAVRLNTDPENCCQRSGLSESYKARDVERWHRHMDGRA